MDNDWGTDNEWRKVALHFNIEDENPRLKLIKQLDINFNQRKYAKYLMKQNGIWNQARQIAKENDLDIMP